MDNCPESGVVTAVASRSAVLNEETTQVMSLALYSTLTFTLTYHYDLDIEQK